MPSAALQLRLLPSARPLDDHLGACFFRTVPHEPGIYRMFGAEGRLLYVGKAGDLRQRLTSYRSLTHASRKTTRLLHLVRLITWEVCATEEQATLRENDLLRTCRPPFNRMGVWPQANGYLELSEKDGALRLRFTRRPAGVLSAPTNLDASQALFGDESVEQPEPGAAWPAPGGASRLFGAFRPGARQACAALARLLWGLDVDWPEPGRMPGKLLRLDGRGCDLPSLPGHTTRLLLDFLEGTSPALLNVCAGFAETPGSPFLRDYWRNEWELARQFYVAGPARNRELRARFGGAQALLAEPELDDLTVRWRRLAPA